MEREVILTGIGGQGVQLAAKILAEAANREGREVMMFGVFMGMIRGGSSESTVVISTEEIIAPPIVPRTWAVLGLHPEGLPALREKIRPQGVLVLDANLAPRPPEWPDIHRLMVPATDIAKGIGQPMGGAMVVLGAFATTTGLVASNSLTEAMRHLLPPHRRHLADGNQRCIEAGVEFARAGGHADGAGARTAAWG
jgi:Pyruvate/2-oxoacid:ferredoxin oxidoreductase gamma subunit